MQNRNILALGMFSLALGLVGQYLARNHIQDNAVLNFFAGLFIGMSIILNLIFLIRNRKKVN